MTWVKLDEDFANHPKVRQAGPLGIAMQVAALGYCNKYLTDGFVPRTVVPSLLNLEGLAMRCWSGELVGGGEDATWQLVVEDLIDAGLWEQAEGGYRIHDYLEYQPSRAQVLQERAQKQEAGRKGGKASTQARAQAPAQADGQAPAKAPAQAKSKPVSVSVSVPDSVSVPPSGGERADPPQKLQDAWHEHILKDPGLMNGTQWENLWDELRVMWHDHPDLTAHLTALAAVARNAVAKRPNGRIKYYRECLSNPAARASPNGAKPPNNAHAVLDALRDELGVKRGD